MDNTIDHTFESANRVYDKNNLCPTIPTCAGGGIQPKIIEETRCVGGLSDGKWGKQCDQQDRVYKGDIALAQPANLPKGSYKYIVAMRGRNPEHPTDRTPGLPTEQRLEMAQEGMTNTLTTVQKDNLVLESCRMVRTEEGVENEIERKTNLLQILRERVEEETFCEWAIRGLLCILQTEILRQNVYAKSIFKSWEKSSDLEQFTHDSKGNQSIITDKEQLRDMWEKWALRCTPYRQQLSEQQYRELESFVQKLSHENTSFHVFMFSLWEAGEGIWVLRKALSEIQEIWKPTSDKQGAWSYRIRKLTPREVWRLMGYTDTDYDKASAVNSNTQLYKEAGNAIVKQVLMAIFSQMNIKGVKPWNDMTSEEKNNLIRKSTTEKKSKNN